MRCSFTIWICLWLGGVALLAQPASPSAGSRAEIQPPLPRSAVDYLRDLLALSPARRDRELAGKSDAQRRFYAAKLREYDALPPAQREARLSATQFQLYLQHLIQLPTAERQVVLQGVEENYRAPLRVRLEQWNRLPADLQRDLIENQTVLTYFARPGTNPVNRLRPVAADATNTVSPRLAAALQRWEALPESRRHQASVQFQKFFGLDAAEREQALKTLPPGERQQTRRAIQPFVTLPAAQRRQCIESIRRFMELPKGEQAEFLQNAERWRSMSPGERDAWKRLVAELPPVPPGAVQSPLGPAEKLFVPPDPPVPGRPL